jgi:hypothetical protein
MEFGDSEVIALRLVIRQIAVALGFPPGPPNIPAMIQKIRELRGAEGNTSQSDRRAGGDGPSAGE